jgi:CheY-like chemotaxis protein/DNA-directed RNA polymerase specialized sigma24 family protein
LSGRRDVANLGGGGAGAGEMSIVQEVSAHIPFLRRFGRALVGSREGGDACVMATLEALVARPAQLAAGDNLRVSLYRALLDIWAAAPINGAEGPVAGPLDPETGARRRLDAISLRPRIAFLLNALEGFDVAEVGEILGIDAHQAAGLVEAANTEIADQIATDVLIIEDEPFIAHDLRSIVEELGHRVVGMARTHREAVSAIRQGEPGLILADIQLADGSSGLDAVNEILGALSSPVIFVTAYPERFLTGAPPEPAFLVTKPFSVESLKAVISQALFFDRRSQRRSA